MAQTDDRRSQTEDLQEHLHRWKQQRFANGENPMDWVAFRQHLAQIGAPDPGETAPDEFYRWDESLVGGTPDGEDTQMRAFGKSGDVPADDS